MSHPSGGRANRLRPGGRIRSQGRRLVTNVERLCQSAMERARVIAVMTDAMIVEERVASAEFWSSFSGQDTAKDGNLLDAALCLRLRLGYIR